MADKKKRRLWIILGSAACLILIAVIFGKKDKGPRIATDMVGYRTITEIVSANGKIQPEFEVKISADVSGEIIDLHVKEGDSVTKGQLLLRINPDIYESQLNQLKANLDNGKAALAGNEAQRLSSVASFNQAESEYKRIKKLWDQKVVSEAEYEQARLKMETAKANLAATEKSILASRYTVQSLLASLEQGRKNLNRTSIYAPTNGIITNMNAEKGERVVGTAQMAGTEILRVSNLNSMEVEVTVNENDIIRIKMGDSADIHVDAWQDRVFKGVVTEIANSARFAATSSIAEQATNYVVKVRLLPSSYADLGLGGHQPFRPGMTATVDIRTLTRSKVLAIPIAAVTTREPAMLKKAGEKQENKSTTQTITRTWVFVYSNGKVSAREVKTGIQDINYFEVTEGLKENEEVVSAPGMTIARRLNDGDKVNKVDKDEVFETK